MTFIIPYLFIIDKFYVSYKICTYCLQERNNTCMEHNESFGYFQQMDGISIIITIPQCQGP